MASIAHSMIEGRVKRAHSLRDMCYMEDPNLLY